MKPLNIIGLIFFAAGVLTLIGFTLYEIIESVLQDADVSTIVTFGIVSIILGVIIILISLIAERIKDNKKRRIKNMLITTVDTIPGRQITENLGLVKGNTIRAKHIGKDIVAGLRSVVGGEIKEYTEALSEARNQAINRMIDEAKKLGADAVVCVRFTTSQVMRGAAELLVYGTAVKLSK